MFNNKYVILFPVAFLLLLGNFFLFYYIIGMSVFLPAIIIFVIIIIAFVIYTLQKRTYLKPPVFTRQDETFGQEQSLQSLQKTNFTLRKRILLVEIIVIMLLLLNLLFKFLSLNS